MSSTSRASRDRLLPAGIFRRTQNLTPETRAFLLPAALALAAVVIYTLGRSPFLGQWDSFDYAKQIVTHRLSDLGFGRPVFIAVNVLAWEVSKRIFRLGPPAVEHVAMAVVILSGAAGVLLFRRLARNILPPHAASLAVAAFLLSPIYAVYSGCIMTDVPMLAIVLAAAVLLWEGRANPGAVRLIGAGLLFGAAMGVREQALSLAPALAWVLLVRVPAGGRRIRALLVLGSASFFAASAPVIWLYLYDPVGFWNRTSVWLSAIPTGKGYFWTNVQATAVYTVLLLPAAWVAALAAVTVRRSSGPGSFGDRWIARPVPAVVLCLLVPLAALWRDADVQIHPRYVLPVLPAAVILCAAVFARRFGSVRGAVAWCVLQLLVFTAGLGVLRPLRAMQAEKREYAERVVEAVPGEALLIAGAYSPVFDFYRAAGIRPDWRILWSGWGWDAGSAESAIRAAGASRVPIYICDGPWAWLNFEGQRLDLHFLLGDRELEPVAPGLSHVGQQARAPRVFRPQTGSTYR